MQLHAVFPVTLNLIGESDYYLLSTNKEREAKSS